MQSRSHPIPGHLGPWPSVPPMASSPHSARVLVSALIALAVWALLVLRRRPAPSRRRRLALDLGSGGIKALVVEQAADGRLTTLLSQERPCAFKADAQATPGGELSAAFPGSAMTWLARRAAWLSWSRTMVMRLKNHERKKLMWYSVR